MASEHDDTMVTTAAAVQIFQRSVQRFVLLTGRMDETDLAVTNGDGRQRQQIVTSCVDELADLVPTADSHDHDTITRLRSATERIITRARDAHPVPGSAAPALLRVAVQTVESAHVALDAGYDWRDVPPDVVALLQAPCETATAWPTDVQLREDAHPTADEDR